MINNHLFCLSKKQKQNTPNFRNEILQIIEIKIFTNKKKLYIILLKGDFMEYIERIIDKKIARKMKATGAVYIRGPKWCGKTTSATRFAKSVLNMQDSDNQKRYLEIAETKPSLLLEGDKPRLLDEWQIAPVLWNAVRFSVDTSGLKGQFLLTGSATPKEDDSLHSGTGRFSFVDMKPLTLYEMGISDGKISLSDILDGKRDIDGITSNISYEELATIIARGGWPNSMSLDDDAVLESNKDYIEAVCHSDISRVDGVTRNPDLAKTILKAYARSICTINSDETIYKDVLSNYGDVSTKTISDYINVLKKLFLIEEIPAWNPNIRSKTSIRTSPKKTFVDPSLAMAALESTPKDLMFDPETFGLMFENLVNRDLSVYADDLGGYLRHFRDRFGLECDNVLHFSNGKYALIEVKLTGNGVKKGEENLLKILELIKENNKNAKSDLDKIREPEFLMVITGSDNIAYTTENNVLVVPIGCLKN